MAEVAIVVTGEPVERVLVRRGGWSAMIRDAIGEVAVRFADLDARRVLPSLVDYRAVIVTGSAASVPSRASWIVETERRLADAVGAEVPIFGICFGHQLLGQALGGRVAVNPLGREIGTVSVERISADPLLDWADGSFLTNMTHVDSIVELPRGARVLGRSDQDSNAFVRFAERVWGVQFHPEIDAAVMLDYLEARREVLEAEGRDWSALRRAVAETPIARGLLRRFLNLALAT
ncbi:MAG TPA: glutamine amidotransferase [Polyangiaceae bacterium]